MNISKNIPGLKEELLRVRAVVEENLTDNLGAQPLSDIIAEQTAASGKMLRPTSVLLCGRIGPDYPVCGLLLVRAAALVEMTHMASLVHDDVVDDAPLRRGRPTVQSKYGKDMAVYAGDYILSRVLRLLAEPELHPIAAPLAAGLADMCRGELTQYQNRIQAAATENDYFLSIAGKTAALFAVSCETGALLSGCNKELVSQLRHFGNLVGVLFQLRDDLLDLSPRPAVDGKQAGADFRQGLYSLPVLYTFSEPRYAQELREMANRAAAGEDYEPISRRVTELVDASGGVAYTRWMLQQYRERALSLLQTRPVGESEKYLRRIVDELAE